MAANLKLYVSNKLEKLAEIFGKNSFPPGETNIFTPKIAVVGSQGMAVYLTQQICKAQSGGIAFNLQTPFLTNFIDKLLYHWFDDQGQEELAQSAANFDLEALALRIAALLTDHPEQYPTYKSYIDNDVSGVRLVQLATKLSQQIDRCSFYREQVFAAKLSPEWGDQYQELHTLIAELTQSGCNFRNYFLQKMLGMPPQHPEKIPPRVAIFGISALPRPVLSVLHHLAEYCAVDLYLLMPCKEYWGDLPNRRAQLQAIARGDATFESFAQDNSALAELGELGRDFLDLLLEENIFSGEESETQYFVDVPAKSALQQFQQDLLTNTNRLDREKFFLSGDDSIVIHRCYQARREVEQLHDELLQMISQQDIKPGDILVVAPNIAEYAPLIQAIFDRGPLAQCYAICDRPLQSLSSAAEALEVLLNIHHTRAGARDLLDLLYYPVIRDCFKIAESELPQLEKLIDQAQIYWGENGQERQEKSGIAFEQFSWQPGLDALMLGVAVETPDWSPELADATLLPCGNAEGQRAELVGKLTEFCQIYFDFRHQLSEKHSISQWSSIILKLIDKIFSARQQYAPEIDILRHELYRLAQLSKNAKFEPDITVEAFHELLMPHLSSPSGKQQFLHGKITFCSFLPMRSVPVKVIAVLGLSDGKFPRQEHQNAFALPGSRQKGDPSPNREDRYMLLETLISAQEKLLCFFSGYNPDGTKLAPAIPLAELINLWQRSYSVTVQDDSRHNYDLQNFAASARCRSFSQSDLATAIQLAQSRTAHPANHSGIQLTKLPLPDTLTLDDWAEALSNPCQTFLQKRCQLKLKNAEILPKDNYLPPPEIEPMELEVWPQMQLMQSIWALKLQNISPEQQFKLLQISNRLPVGELGKNCFETLQNHLAKIPDVFKFNPEDAQKFLIDLPIKSTRISGIISGTPVKNDGSQCLLYFGKAHKKPLLKLYLGHLLLNVANPTATANSQGFFLDYKGEVQLFFFNPLEPDLARVQLESLLELYGEILNSPQPLFPHMSPAYIEALQADVEDIETAMRKKFASGGSYGDDTDPAISLFYDINTFWSEKFENLAQLVYKPILDGKVIKNEGKPYYE